MTLFEQVLVLSSAVLTVLLAVLWAKDVFIDN